MRTQCSTVRIPCDKKEGILGIPRGTLGSGYICIASFEGTSATIDSCATYRVAQAPQISTTALQGGLFPTWKYRQCFKLGTHRV